MNHLIVEYSFEQPLTDEQLAESSAKLRDCLDLRNIKWVQTYLSRDRRKQICIFQGADEQSVREAYLTAKVKFDRVWEAFLPFAP